MAGYSGTPLLQKLGYAAGQRALLVGLPKELQELAGFAGFERRELRPELAELPEGPFDLVHVFERERAALEENLGGLRARLAPTGMVWVSWPKKAAGVPTTLTEDVVRAMALSGGLVDVKVCAVDAVWSGLKLVIPRALRGRGVSGGAHAEHT
jgi:hypothetical protein